MQHSLRSFLRLCLRCPFCLADRLRLSGQKGNTHCVRSYACGYAVQPALQIALRLFGQDGKHRSALARAFLSQAMPG